MTNHESRSREVPRSDFRSLVRSRAVQVLLVAVAGVQGVASYGGERGSLVHDAVKDGVSLGMSQSPVQMPVQLAKAAPSEEIAAAYRAKGYEVPPTLAAKIYAAAVKHEIDPEVAFGLVRTESEFRDYATSRVGAIGLTQLMPGTARWFQRNITVAQLRDSDTNLEIGFRYLRELIDRYEGDLHLALTAYNRGTGTVDRVMEKGQDPDNGYAGLVMKGSR